MSRLIFFSGGVESTALLTQAKPSDILVTINPTYPYGQPTYRKESVDLIAAYFGMKTNYAQISIPVEPEPYNFVHQLASFVAVAHLWVVKDLSIREIWAGRNSSEVPKVRDPSNFKTQQLLAWNYMHSGIPFRHPLEHLSKLEQWQMIPDQVKPLINSCVTYNACGKCLKCQEFQNMLNNHE